MESRLVISMFSYSLYQAQKICRLYAVQELIMISIQQIRPNFLLASHPRLGNYCPAIIFITSTCSSRMRRQQLKNWKVSVSVYKAYRLIQEKIQLAAMPPMIF